MSCGSRIKFSTDLKNLLRREFRNGGSAGPIPSLYAGVVSHFSTFVTLGPGGSVPSTPSSSGSCWSGPSLSIDAGVTPQPFRTAGSPSYQRPPMAHQFSGNSRATKPIDDGTNQRWHQ